MTQNANLKSPTSPTLPIIGPAAEPAAVAGGPRDDKAQAPRIPSDQAMPQPSRVFSNPVYQRERRLKRRMGESKAPTESKAVESSKRACVAKELRSLAWMKGEIERVGGNGEGFANAIVNLIEDLPSLRELVPTSVAPENFKLMTGDRRLNETFDSTPKKVIGALTGECIYVETTVPIDGLELDTDEFRPGFFNKSPDAEAFVYRISLKHVACDHPEIQKQFNRLLYQGLAK